jgi:hypothetical protein
MGTPVICECARKVSRVIVDVDSGTITFERCHWPRRFWALRPEERYTCHLTDILEIHHDSLLTWLLTREARWQGATIVTHTGKASINSLMSGFNEVLAAITANSQAGSGRLLDNQNVWTIGVALLAFAMAGLGLLWVLS